MSPVASDPTPGAAPAAVAEQAKAQSKTRYCIVETPTGSHRQRKTCHTREEWARQGVDLPEK